MAIRPLPRVIPVPVLIRSNDHTSVDGVGTLFTLQDTEISGLHVVSKQEAFAHLDKWERSKPDVQQLVRGAALMQRAQREKNWISFQNALDLVQKWVPCVLGDAEIQHIRGSKSWKKAGWAYSGLMSNLLQTTRFTMWYSPKDNRLHPGLFCPDWEVAVYAIVGMDHIRICKKPGCGVPFIPDPMQEYCNPAHGNSDRVARSKAKKRRREKQRKK